MQIAAFTSKENVDEAFQVAAGARMPVQEVFWGGGVWEPFSVPSVTAGASPPTPGT